MGSDTLQLALKLQLGVFNPFKAPSLFPFLERLSGRNVARSCWHREATDDGMSPNRAGLFVTV